MHENVVSLFEQPAPAPAGDFEAIWKLWPNKAKKVLAKAKYDAILKGGFKTRTLDKDSGQYVEIELAASPDEILAGVKAYVTAQVDRRTFKLKDDGKFIPHLATFLNQGRWEDFQ
jgi:hypothetical protein